MNVAHFLHSSASSIKAMHIASTHTYWIRRQTWIPHHRVRLAVIRYDVQPSSAFDNLGNAANILHEQTPQQDKRKRTSTPTVPDASDILWCTAAIVCDHYPKLSGREVLSSETNTMSSVTQKYVPMHDYVPRESTWSCHGSKRYSSQPAVPSYFHRGLAA